MITSVNSPAGMDMNPAQYDQFKTSLEKYSLSFLGQVFQKAEKDMKEIQSEIKSNS